MKAFYLQRITKAVDFIEDNLDKKLSLDQLAEVAMFSKYHFHRIFKTIIGETLNDYIKRIRMIHAYRFLQADKTLEISDLAFRFGYHSLANFSRDFKAFHGISASEVKKQVKYYSREHINLREKALMFLLMGFSKYQICLLPTRK